MAITEDGMRALLALQAHDGTPLPNTRSVTQRAGTAVIPLSGPLVREGSWMSQMLGLTAYETVRKDLEAALENDDIKAIVFDVDSPGGEVSGAGELSKAIFEARGRKPIVAYVSGMMASAAYWVASAADKIVTDQSGILGSIGVRTVMVDTSKLEDNIGVVRYDIVSSQSPYKVPDAGDKEDRARVRETMNQLANVFIADVARNRGISEASVISGYGKGDVLVGKTAKAAGLADELGSFESVLSSLAPSRPTSKRVSMSKPTANMKAAKCDGCDRDMDDDDDVYCRACHGEADASAFVQSVHAIVGAKDNASAIGILTAFKSQADELATVKAELESIKTAKAALETKQLIDAAMLDGRITGPANRITFEKLYASHGLAALQAALSVIPRSKNPAVPPGKDWKPEGEAAVLDTGAFTEAQIKIMKMTGQDPAAVIAYAPKYRQILNPTEEK
jgi:signal peptide peptidase SppA